MHLLPMENDDLFLKTSNLKSLDILVLILLIIFPGFLQNPTHFPTNSIQTWITSP